MRGPNRNKSSCHWDKSVNSPNNNKGIVCNINLIENNQFPIPSTDQIGLQLYETSAPPIPSHPPSRSSDLQMKRPNAAGETCRTALNGSVADKKIRLDEEGKVYEASKEIESVLLDENLLYEVLRHVDDGRTLAKAACVSRQWRKTAHDERLWELICTRYYHRSPMQLRSVVLALGGFRRLYSSHLWPLLKPAAPSTSVPPVVSAWPSLPLAPTPSPAPGASRSRSRWGKDEVNLSLSLLSIKYFEKMSFNNRSK